MKNIFFEKFIIAGLAAVLSVTEMNSQTLPLCGSVPNNTNTVSSAAPCTPTSTTWFNKYQKPLTYGTNPNQLGNEPIITLKITLHIFTDNFGNGMWENTNDPIKGTQALISACGNFINGTGERFSALRTSTYPNPNGWTSPHNPDSRIQYEISNIYYYANTFLYSSNDVLAHNSFIDTYYPGRLQEGLPILICNNGWNFQASTAYGPAVYTSVGPWAVNPTSSFFDNHLRHEIGHCFNLGHTYQNGGDDWQISSWQAACGQPNYLFDVFPSPMTSCPYQTTLTTPPIVPPSNGTCQSCYELVVGHPTNTTQTIFNNASNNLMGGQYPNDWMSPIQTGRRRKMMHLDPRLRQYAKEVNNPNASATWDITSNETWDFDIQMYQNIVVKTGNTLRITCRVAMPKDGKILVEKGAKLIIDGGIVTTWSKTGFWRGIEIDGTSTQDQLIYNPTGLCPNQGIVEVVNSATLTNAGISITNGSTDNNGNFNWGSQGGIIIGSNSYFINNIRDVQFLSYLSPMGNDKSNFTNCNFLTTSTLIANTVPDSRVSLWDVRGVSFKGCNFQYSAGNAYPLGSRGSGLVSIDATYNVDCKSPCGATDKTVFTGFQHGIYVANSNPLRVVTVKNSKFYNSIWDGVYFSNMNSEIFEDNYLSMPGIGSGNGLYLNNSKNYIIKNNTFLQDVTVYPPRADVGIYVNNSQAGAHYIYRNVFNNLNVGIGAMHDNSGYNNNTDGLLMNCNDFTGDFNKYDVALMHDLVNNTFPTVKTTQGVLPPFSNFNNLVRNRYGAFPQSPIYENQWYIQDWSAKGYDHGSNSDANTQPVPQPNYSDVAVNVVNSGIAFLASHCPSSPIPTVNPCPCHGCCRLMDINSAFSNAIPTTANLQSQYNSSIDGGNTLGLLSAVSGGVSNGDLNTLLENASPYLSDEVLIAYFSKSGIPAVDITEIHNLNKPVSTSVWETIVNLNLQSDVISEITSNQSNSSVSARKALESQLSFAKFNLQSIMSEKLNYFLTDTLVSSKDSIIELLTANIGQMQNRDVLLTYAYMDMGRYSDAIDKARDVEKTDVELANLLMKLIALENDPKKAYSLLDNQTELTEILELASRNGSGAQPAAQALGKFLLGINYEVPRLFPLESGGSGRLSKQTFSDESYLLENKSFKVFPNPTTNILNVVYQNNDNKSGLRIELIDTFGRIVYTTITKFGQPTQISLSDFTEGVYVLTVYDGKTKLYQSKVVKVN